MTGALAPLRRDWRRTVFSEGRLGGGGRGSEGRLGDGRARTDNGDLGREECEDRGRGLDMLAGGKWSACGSLVGLGSGRTYSARRSTGLRASGVAHCNVRLGGLSEWVEVPCLSGVELSSSSRSMVFTRASEVGAGAVLVLLRLRWVGGRDVDRRDAGSGASWKLSSLSSSSLMLSCTLNLDGLLSAAIWGEDWP
jgi:hypothetical protein